MQPGDVVMLGDSITEGADWEELLPRVRVHNYDIGGGFLPRVRRRAGQVGGVNRGLERVAQDRGATWIDLQPLFDRGDGCMDLALAPDALHPNAHGYRRWADVVATFVTETRPAQSSVSS